MNFLGGKFRMKRIISIILLLVLLLITCSCSKTQTVAETTAVVETTTAETEEELKSNLPNDLDLNGMELIIFHTSDDMFAEESLELSGDVVNDAIFKRNSTVMEQLNVSLVYMENDDYDCAPEVRASVLAGSDDFQIVSGSQWIVAPLVLENTLMNLAVGSYLDLEQPWWAVAYNREAAIGDDVRFFITGDITLCALKRMSCMYFNKSFYENIYGDPNDMYGIILDGDWTLDKFGELGSGCYSDLNGDGVKNKDDQYGYGVITANLTDHFTYDAGIRASTRDSSGIPELTINNEKTINFTEKLYDIYYNNDGVYVFEPTGDSVDKVMPAKFAAGEMLYNPGWFYTADRLRDMESDYGVIPFPKYNEKEEKYLSLMHDTILVYCCPITIGNKFEPSCAVMEALAFEGYRLTLPAYYDVALKIKYVRDSDDDALKIVDMIHDGATTDFAYIYNYTLNGIGLIMRQLMGSKSADFASKYAQLSGSALKLFDELIELYTAL